MDTKDYIGGDYKTSTWTLIYLDFHHQLNLRTCFLSVFLFFTKWEDNLLSTMYHSACVSPSDEDSFEQFLLCTLMVIFSEFQHQIYHFPIHISVYLCDIYYYEFHYLAFLLFKKTKHQNIMISCLDHKWRFLNNNYKKFEM